MFYWDLSLNLTMIKCYFRVTALPLILNMFPQEFKNVISHVISQHSVITLLFTLPLSGFNVEVDRWNLVIKSETTNGWCKLCITQLLFFFSFYSKLMKRLLYNLFT